MVTLALSCLLFTGCATLPEPDCERVQVGDTVVRYCKSQERVRLKCAKKARKTDDGVLLDFDGRTADGREIKACTYWYPNAPEGMPRFSVWLWKTEAWRRSHEDCHIAVFRAIEAGEATEADHARCARFGCENERKVFR